MGLNEALVSRKYISHRKSQSGLPHDSSAVELHYVASASHQLMKFRKKKKKVDMNAHNVEQYAKVTLHWDFWMESKAL